jgi:hypothetical protein
MKQFIFAVTLTNKQYQSLKKIKSVLGVKSDAGLLQKLIEKSGLGFIKLD